MRWMLLARTTVHLDDREIPMTSTRDTGLDLQHGRPVVAMSTLNEVRRTVAASFKTEVANVTIEWFDLVAGDEPVAS